MSAAPYFKKHVFFCLNQRPDGQVCCASHGAEAAFAHTKARLQASGLSGPGQIRVNRAGCLGRCDQGPVLVVYPQGTWYTYVDLSDLDDIIEHDLIGGQPVARLRLPAP